MSEPDIENLSKGAEYMTAAGRLHLMLGEHATENVVVKALVWAYALCEWDAKKVYAQSLKLLDAMGKLKR